MNSPERSDWRVLASLDGLFADQCSDLWQFNYHEIGYWYSNCTIVYTGDGVEPENNGAAFLK